MSNKNRVKKREHEERESKGMQENCRFLSKKNDDSKEVTSLDYIQETMEQE